MGRHLIRKAWATIHSPSFRNPNYVVSRIGLPPRLGYNGIALAAYAPGATRSVESPMRGPRNGVPKIQTEG